ncbi:MAG: LysE family transporter [Ottowia sp.]
MAATLGLIAGDQVLLWCAARRRGGAAAARAGPGVAGPCSGWARPTWPGWAWRMLSACAREQGGAPAAPARQRPFLRQAFLITLLNPKAIVFYMAFLAAVRRSGAAPGRWSRFGMPWR